MICGKFWIALVLVSVNTALAQQTPKTQVTIQVTDVTGARVPKAIVEVAPLPNTQKLTFEADENGTAEFALPTGNYDLQVKSQGFCPFRKFLEPLNGKNQVVTAKLIPGSCPGPCAGPCVTVYSESGAQVYPKPGTQDLRSSQDLLKVIVTDTAGAVIQPAWVEAISTSPGEFGQPWSANTSTNTLGEASLGLPKGNYVLSVTANGFKKWFMQSELGAHPNQTIRVKMVFAEANVRADCMSCLSLQDEQISPYSITFFTIPPLSFRTLDPLPTRPARRYNP